MHLKPLAYTFAAVYHNFPAATHRMKWRHRICGHDTIAILWVWHDIMCWVDGRWFFRIIEIKLNPLVYENVRLPTKLISARSQYKHLSEFYPQDGGESQLASKLHHCHRMYRLRSGTVWYTDLVSEQHVTGAPTDPCRNYQLMELADRGLRHPNVTVTLDRANTCDYYFDESRLLCS